MNQWDKIYQSEKDKSSSPLQSFDDIIVYYKKNDVSSILDLGCGSGQHSLYLAKKGFNVTGFDISNEAIKLAKDRLSKNKEKKLSITFRQGSMHTRLPFEDGSFDAIVCLRTLNHGTKKQIKKTISEMYRVLKNGGYVFLTVIKINGKKNILGKTKLNSLSVKITAPYTYIPLEGMEREIVHFMFNKKLLFNFFKKFKIIKFGISYGLLNWEKYYYLLAQKKK